MRTPCQKVVICHKCGYEVLSRDTFFKRNLNKHPYYCGKCGSRDFIEIVAKGYHLVIARKREDIEKAVAILEGSDYIPSAFVNAFNEEKL